MGADVRWSATYGSFYSHEACQKLEGKDTYNSRYKVSSLARSETRSASDDKKAPVMNNFDKIAEKEVESEKIPTPPSEPEPESVPEPSDEPQPDAEKIPEEIPTPPSEPELVPEPEQIPEPEPEPETVPPPPKDEATTAMPAEALDTSTNPPVEQEDANNEDEVDKAPTADPAKEEVEETGGKIDASELLK